MTQLSIELEAPAPNPNAWMFHPDGSMKMLLWPDDEARMMHERTSPGGYLVIAPIYGCCSFKCPLCNPGAFRCEFGCCP